MRARTSSPLTSALINHAKMPRKTVAAKRVAKVDFWLSRSLNLAITKNDKIVELENLKRKITKPTSKPLLRIEAFSDRKRQANIAIPSARLVIKVLWSYETISITSVIESNVPLSGGTSKELKNNEACDR